MSVSMDSARYYPNVADVYAGKGAIVGVVEKQASLTAEACFVR